MAARTLVLACAVCAYAAVPDSQDPNSIFVSVTEDFPTEDPLPDIEKRYTPDLQHEVSRVKNEVLFLYTQYQTASAVQLRHFLRNVSEVEVGTMRDAESGLLSDAPPQCRTAFQKRLSKISLDARRGASFSAENHHKFFLGHMIVFRMHIHKSEDFIKKCLNYISNCGEKCETVHKMVIWRKKAAKEIDRVNSDIEFSRRSYEDLLSHGQRRLKNIRKHLEERKEKTITDLRECIDAQT